MDIKLGCSPGDIIRYTYGGELYEGVIIKILERKIPEDLRNLYEMGLYDDIDFYDFFLLKTDMNHIIKRSKVEVVGYKKSSDKSLDYFMDVYKIFNKESLRKTKKKTEKEINISMRDYKILNDRVVIVTFADGSTEKATCSPEDKFDLERAIELCLVKKLVGGTKAYNNIVKKAMKQVEQIDNAKKMAAAEEERIAKKKIKIAERKARRAEKKRQEQIDIQAEAFLKAMNMYDEQIEKNDVSIEVFNEKLAKLNAANNISEN